MPKVFPLSERSSLRGGGRRPAEDHIIHAFQSEERRFALREVLFLGIAALGAWLFLNHELLEGGRPPAWNLSQFIVSTIIVYLFLRMIVVVAEMRGPRAHAALVRCPECGQRLDDPSAAGLAEHRRTETAPRPSDREIVSAVALRKALDAARNAATIAESTAADPPAIPSSDLEDATGQDVPPASDDPDLLERLRRGPHPPRDGRFRR